MMLLLLAALSCQCFSFIFLFLGEMENGEIKKALSAPRCGSGKTISDLITIKEAVLVFIGTDLEQQGIETLSLEKSIQKK